MLFAAFRPQEIKKVTASERSASQIDRVIQRLWRGAEEPVLSGVEEPVLSGVEGTPAVLILPRLFGAFQPPKPAPGGATTVFSPGPRTRNLPASCYVEDDICGRKAPSSMGKVSTAQIPSTPLRTGSSTPRQKLCGTRSIGAALRSEAVTFLISCGRKAAKSICQ